MKDARTQNSVAKKGWENWPTSSHANNYFFVTSGNHLDFKKFLDKVHEHSKRFG